MEGIRRIIDDCWIGKCLKGSYCGVMCSEVRHWPLLHSRVIRNEPGLSQVSELSFSGCKLPVYQTGHSMTIKGTPCGLPRQLEVAPGWYLGCCRCIVHGGTALLLLPAPSNSTPLGGWQLSPWRVQAPVSICSTQRLAGYRVGKQTLISRYHGDADNMNNVPGAPNRQSSKLSSGVITCFTPVPTFPDVAEGWKQQDHPVLNKCSTLL
jgi:hypothetical protein